MAKRNPGKSRAQPDEVPEANPAGSVVIDAADDGLEALANSLAGLDDPSGHEVLLYEIDDRGRRAVLCRIAPADFDPFTVAEEWGGGNYCAQVRESSDGKRIVTQRNFSVAPTIKGKRREGAIAKPAEAKADQGVLALAMTMMQTASQQTTALLSAMLSRPNELAAIVPALIPALQGPKPSTDIAQLVGALGALDQLRGDAAPPAAAGESEYAWMAGPLTVLVQGMMQRQQEQAHAPAAVQRRPHASPPTHPHAQPSVRREPATAVLSSAVAGPASQPTDQAGDVDAAALEQVRAVVIARLVLGKGIDPRDLAASLDNALDPEALGELIDNTPAGTLTARLMEGVPAELAAAVSNPAMLQTLGDLESELRAIVAQHDQDQDQQNQAGDDTPAQEPQT